VRVAFTRKRKFFKCQYKHLNASTIDSNGRVDIGGADGQSKGLVLTGNAPTITLKDTNNRSGMISMNGANMFFLSGEANSEAWERVNGECLLY